ncbi:MAG: YifB family Mg chelatase-like AAA ATPase [Solirubrobacterales bacterium]
MLARVRTFTLVGVEARPVWVEADVARGLPAFSLVGLPDTAVRESRERVRAAIANSGFEFPLRRITVSLAPADVPKAGPALDLAIAAAVLAASGQVPEGSLDGGAVAGELGLDGSVRPVAGALAMAEGARNAGSDSLTVASADAGDATLVDGLRIVPVQSLGELVALASGEAEPRDPDPPRERGDHQPEPDLVDLRGQPVMRRGLEIAAAGGHHLLVTGPPGSGKSLALRRLPGLLPPLAPDERLEVARIAGIRGRSPVAGRRPFRAPHHSVSRAGLLGGGSPPRPGEITLAHRGVLFLDELAEFPRATLEALRQPLEEGTIRIARARHTVTLPCRFQLAAAANPCPCGHGDSDPRCRCAPVAVERYRTRLSAALADRIDIQLAIGQPSASGMAGEAGEGSVAVCERTTRARERAMQRAGHANADIDTAGVRRLVLTQDAQDLVERSQRLHGLSGRGHDRLLRVARTIADLAAAEEVEADHVAEALALRRRGGDR